MKRTIITTAVAALAVALVLPSAPASAGKTVKLAKDPAGDWGSNVDPTISPLGDALGQDIIGAAMSSDKKNVNFIIELNSLPAIGWAPEVTRYQWEFSTKAGAFELDGKFTNYSRGACDPTSGQCPPPRDPGMQPFMLRGNCVSGTVVTCEELGFIQAQFDAAKGTITIPVPMKAIKVKRGSKVLGGAITTSPAAFFTVNAGPNDTLSVIKAYKIPR